MKVAFTGAQGTGKTTLARKVAELDDWTFFTGVSYDAVQAGYKVNRDADPLSQLITTVARISNEFRLESEGVRNLILDRSLIDSLAYTAYQFEAFWEDNPKNRFYYKHSKTLVQKHVKEYDALFYFPAYWIPRSRPDGLRDEDALYQGTIDFHVQWFLQEFEVPYVTMPDVSVEERLDLFRNCVMI